MISCVFAFVLGAVDLRLSLNGKLLADESTGVDHHNYLGPFVDHSHRWPPQLSWTIEGDESESDLQQTAFEVDVDGARTPEFASSAMRHTIRTPTVSNAVHTVGVRVILADGRTIKRTSRFRTALLENDGFGNASWIGGGTLLRRSLDDLAPPSGANVANVTVYASGVGCFSIRLDGEPISSSYMDPGWGTLPTVRVTYRAFDVTRQWTRGSLSQTVFPKMLEVSLGMCKYGYQGSFCVGAHASTDVCKAFLMTLRVTYR